MADTIAALLEQDPFSLELMEDPLPFYRALRDHAPARYYPQYDTFFISRFGDVWDTLRIADNVLVASEGNLPTPTYLRSKRNEAAPPLASTAPMAPGPQLHSPHYERMRQAHIAPLRPGSMKSVANDVNQIVEDRLAELLARGKLDLVGEYAGFCAAAMICKLFGMPADRGPEILSHVSAMTRFDPEKEGVDLPSFFIQLKGILLPVIEGRRKAGADGSNALVDGLIGWLDPETGRALGDSEIADQLVCVMVGGLESVAKVTGQGIMELCSRPDQMAAVRADLHQNVPIAIEEMIRYCAPAQYTFRTAHRDVTVAGQDVRAGQRVACLLHSASRDEREYPNPDAFIWNRPIDRVISFGLGQHHCIGKHLAKLELKSLVHNFLTEVKEFEFAMDEAERNPSCFQRGWTKLPIRVRARNG